ncbi:hypothetical protein PENTCL1PPCAC_17668, partial [Pristionchus entomophagus]
KSIFEYPMPSATLRRRWVLWGQMPSSSLSSSSVPGNYGKGRGQTPSSVSSPWLSSSLQQQQSPLFVFKMCHISDEAAAYASIVSVVGRFAAMNHLLFGGGYFLLGAGNAARTRSPSSCCSSWFIHTIIVLLSATVAVATVFYSFEMENIPVFMYRIMPFIGCLFLLLSLAMGFLISCCGNEGKESESTEKFLVDAKSRFFQYISFFIAPVTIIVYTRGLDGAMFLLKFLQTVRYWNRYTIEDLAINTPMPPYSLDIEFFFTLSLLLSALILHPSVRNVLCCTAKTEKAKA